MLTTTEAAKHLSLSPRLIASNPVEGGSALTDFFQKFRREQKRAVKVNVKKKPTTQQKNARVVLVRHHSAKRRAVRLQRTPAWADMNRIRDLHNLAARMTIETGVVHHVDHVIPLQGKLVSGLHVHQNMQVLIGSVNSSKGNRYRLDYE